MSRSARRLALLLAAVALVLALVDQLVFPRGIPRDLPLLHWKAERDPFLYALMPHRPVNDEALSVCIVGSSMVRKGVHAATLEAALSESLGRPVRAYNFGIGGAYMCDFVLGLHHALETRPDVVVIGTAFRDYPEETSINPKGTASYELLYDYSFDVPSFMALTGAEEHISYLVKGTWCLFQFRNWIRLNAGALFRAMDNPDAPRDRLFFDSDGELDWAAVGQSLEHVYGTTYRSYPNAQVRCLERALAVGQQEGARVIVVKLPVSSLWHSLDERGAQAELDGMLSSVCGKSGVEFVDATSRHADADFIDSSHLNRAAALSFSRWLARVIAERTPPGGVTVL